MTNRAVTYAGGGAAAVERRAGPRTRWTPAAVRGIIGGRTGKPPNEVFTACSLSVISPLVRGRRSRKEAVFQAGCPDDACLH